MDVVTFTLSSCVASRSTLLSRSIISRASFETIQKPVEFFNSSISVSSIVEDSNLVVIGIAEVRRERGQILSSEKCNPKKTN